MPSRRGSASLARKLGARIRVLRLAAGVTQEQLAWTCDLDKGYLSQVESGKRVPSVPVLFALAKRLQVDSGELVAFDIRRPVAGVEPETRYSVRIPSALDAPVAELAARLSQSPAALLRAASLRGLEAFLREHGLAMPSLAAADPGTRQARAAHSDSEQVTPVAEPVPSPTQTVETEAKRNKPRDPPG